MNGRIEDLAKQAGISFKQMIIEDDVYDYYHVECNDNVGGDEAGCISLFAELLIKDCAAYVKRQCMQPSRFTAADLLERYGIKDE